MKAQTLFLTILTLCPLMFNIVSTYKMLNRTHFVCDTNKTLHRIRLNDDFCDCKDGSDESTTNACSNGVFYCKNRFHLGKNISTSKINDGVCDCCDGSDELTTRRCPITCFESSKIDYETLNAQVSVIESYLGSFGNSIVEDYLELKAEVTKILTTYKELEELNDKHYLVLRYLNYIRSKIGEEEFDSNSEYKDENSFILRELKNSLNKLGEEIYIKEQHLEATSKLSNSLLYHIFIRENEDHCRSGKYKGYTLEVCFLGRVEISGFYQRRWKRVSLGQYKRFEKNSLFFEGGENCGFYNLQKSTRMIIECGSDENIEFKQKVGACHYEFVFKSKLGCNFLGLDQLKNRVTSYLKEI